MLDWRYCLQLLWENFAPRRCEVCGDVITEGIFCVACRDNFLLLKNTKRNDAISTVYMLFKYNQQLRDIIRAIKFQKKVCFIPKLREEAILAFDADWEKFLSNYDLLTWIPTSNERKIDRGFEIPQEIFKFFPKEKYKQLLVRTRQTAPLFDMNKTLREQELQGCFALQGEVKNKKILVVDDIYTTGSTGSEAARTLLNGGAKLVDMLGFTASKDNWEDYC